MEERRDKVKASTLDGYRVVVQLIKGPIISGSRTEKARYSRRGEAPPSHMARRALGDIKLSDLTTAEIRSWHRLVADTSGDYSANRAASHLKAILALAEEDFGVRAPSMPRNLARPRQRRRKAILSPSEIGSLLTHARSDPQHGIYYAFPFLAGTRPSEQLGLLWQDVDFEANLIRIRRVLERDGSSTEMTKTEAGTRDIPMAPLAGTAAGMAADVSEI
jgi:integrase